MSESIKTTIEKYQSLVFGGITTILIWFAQVSFTSMKEEIRELGKGMVSVSHQVAILNTKMDNYDVILKAMQSELKEVSLRVSVIEVKAAKLENELRRNK